MSEKKNDRHRYAVVAFRPAEELRAVLVDLAEKERRSLSQLTQFLVEEALTHRKLWPTQKGKGK